MADTGSHNLSQHRRWTRVVLALSLLVVGASLPPMPVSAAVTPLNQWPSAPTQTATTANPAAANFTVSAGTARLLVVAIACYDSGGSSGQTLSVTYGGTALTPAVLENSNRRQTWIGYLALGDSGTNTTQSLAVTVSGTHTNVAVWAASYSGIDQTTPTTGSSSTYANNVTNPQFATAASVNAGGYGLYIWSSNQTHTSDTESYTEHGEAAAGVSSGVASKAFASAGTTQPTVTFAAAVRGSMSLVTLKPFTGPTPTPTQTPTQTLTPTQTSTPTQTTTATATPVQTCVMVSVSQSSDDAEQTDSGGTTDINNTTLQTYVSTYRRYWGLRFQNVTIPRGSTINSASVTFRATASSSTATMNVYGQDADNALTFTTGSANISGRTSTSATVSWSMGSWTSGSNHTTADLSTVVQEIVNRTGWASGNALVIMGRMPSGQSTNKTVEAYDNTGTNPPSLTICYVPPVNTAPAIGAISFSSNDTPPYVSFDPITMTASTGLTALISDDALPNPPNQVTGTWSKVSGPGTVGFTNNPASGAAPLSHSTTATFSAIGDYVVQLGATDGVLSATPQQFTVKVRLMPAVSMTGGTIPNATSGSVPYCETYPMSRYFLVTNHFHVTDVELGVNLDHASRGEIRGGLTSPDGTYYELIAVNTGDSNHNYDILLDADGGTALNDGNNDDTGTPYYDRTVLQANLNNFELADAFGGWHLTLCDNVVDSTGGTFGRADLFLNGSFFTPIPPIHKQGPAIVETYYIPWPEDDFYTAMNSIFRVGGTGSCSSQAAWDMDPRQPMIGYSSITIGAPDTVITYDQWEDGYEASASFPSQSTTEVWGDGDLTNGVAPGDADDILDTGQILVLDDVMNTTMLGNVVDFDGRDKFSASQPIAVSRSMWSDGPKTLMAHADEVYPTSYWGTSYEVPVGETSPDADNNMFEYTGASVMAMVDGTTVTFTRNGGGTQSCTLNQGQACLWDDTYNTYGTGLTAGSTITSNSGHPIQVNLLTGDYCANFETRSFPLLPTELWASSYYNPVGTLTSSGGPGGDDAPTVVYLFNAGGSSITVSYQFATGGTSTISVPANGSAKVTMTDLSGAHFWTTSGTPFYAVATVDSDAGSGGGDDRNDAYDWGITLVPERLLSEWLIVGWAPGDDPIYTGSAPENTAPIWLTGGHPTGAADQTSTYDICVDYNGDCTSSTCTQDPVTGKYYDRKVTGLAPRAQYKIYKGKVVPPDTGYGTAGDDQTGTQIWVCGPQTGGVLQSDVLITAAWGEDPLTANPARPGMDMGDTIRNVRVWTAIKDATLLDDVNGNGLYDEGDTIRYSVVVSNTGASAIPASTITVSDTLPGGVTYVANSTKLIAPNGSESSVADGTVTLFPLDEGGKTFGQALPPNKSFKYYWAVTINSAAAGTTVCNEGTASSVTIRQPIEVCLPVQEPRVGAIGNYVWLDEDGDGDQDAGEAGIPNVTVQLWDATHTTLLDTTLTDAHGGYLFDNLDAGTYVVDVVYSTLPGILSQTYDEDNGTGPFSTGNSTTVVLAVGQEHLTADFGYNWSSPTETNNPGYSSDNTGAIGDRVWVDTDGDGAQDAEEVGIEGVVVQLFTPGPDGIFGTADDVAGPTDTTDANGNYIFDDLPAGAYVVKVISGVPGTYTQTGDPDHFGTTGSNNDGMTTTPIVLGPGDVFVNADFGYQSGASDVGAIGDYIWFDANADGVQDGTEYGIERVTVALIKDLDGGGTWDAGEPIIATTVTGDNPATTGVVETGWYQFTGLPVTDGTGTDDYLVWINDTNNVLAELAQTYDSDGTGTSNISRVQNLTTAGDLLQDFGYAPPEQSTGEGLIGDTIFLDRNTDGLPDAGEGLEGVMVRLLDSTGDVVATTYTDENGHYSFGGLMAGTYTVQVVATTLPNGGSGLTNYTDPDNAPGAGNNSSSVTIGGANPMINLDQDFGYRPTAAGSIGNLVWNDVNADGNVDVGENGIGGVTVDPYVDRNGNGKLDSGDTLVGSTTTASDGSYLFSNLPTTAAGVKYLVDVTDTAGKLAGYWQSYGSTGVDNNSQVDPYAVTLTTASPNNLTADFGYYLLPAAVGNWVWDDANINGIQDDGESPLAGVEVTLTITYPNGTTTVLKTTTDAGGYYYFGNLLQDEDYTVLGGGTGQPTASITVAWPTGYVPTVLNVGSDDAVDADNWDGQPVVVAKGSVNDTYDFGFYSNPTGVAVTSFTARWRDGAVLVEWRTAGGFNIIGFNLYRAEKPGGEKMHINDVLIDNGVIPGSPQGASYHYKDTTPPVGAGDVYFYWLETVNISGQRRLYGPVQVQVMGAVGTEAPVK
jgi:uncharacterized repeat protein (TIGR01451 family)